MILRRLVDNLRTQNWTAIAIEFLIVVTGVFIGTQVSNWNSQRLEKRETARMLEQLQPELRAFLDFFEGARVYYATTRSYADTAFAGWEGRRDVSDEQFVVAAYQASQVMGIGTNAENWTLIFGGDQLRKIENVELRRAMSTLMTGNFQTVEFTAVATKYREDVRRVIPDPVQVAIRERCGDRPDRARQFLITLPKTCDLPLPAADAKAIAADLRAHPELVRELRWHLAAVSTFLSNAESLETQARALSRMIAEAT